MTRPALACVLALVACSSGGGSGGAGPGPGTADGTPTARGTPTGPPATATIGPAGGTVTSDDGEVTVSVPPGAVSSDTTFSLEPISLPDGGAGSAVRLSAGGRSLSQPVTLTFRYVDADLGEGDAQGLGIAVQDAGGVWRALLSSSVDTNARTVSVGVSQLSASGGGAASHALVFAVPATGTDYARVQFWKFHPRSATLDVNQALSLFVEACVQENPPPEQDPSVDWLAGLPICRPSIRTGRWSVNEIPGGSASLGTVVTTTTSAGALYTAPPAAPSPSTVSVIADMTWEARGVTKRFTSRVTIGGSTFHVLGELSRTAEPIGAFVVAEVTDRVEFDVELSGGGVTVPEPSVRNSASTHTGDRLPPEATEFCAFTVDGPYEFGTYDTFVSGYAPGLLVEVGFDGSSQMASTSYYAPVDGVCTFVFPAPGQSSRTQTSVVEFAPTDFPSVGDEHIVPGTGPFGEANGWDFTVTRTR